MKEQIRQMKPFLALVFFGGTFIFLSSGCMMWMHGMEHGAGHEMRQPVKTVMKEFSDRDVTLGLEVPPFSLGDEVALTARVSRTRSSLPIPGVKVTFLVEQIEPSAGEHAEHRTKAAAEREAEEIAGKGEYRLQYKFVEPGLYRITARVWIDEKEGVAAPLTITLVQGAARHDGHDDRQSVTPWVVIGGIGMAVMMVLMVL